MDEDEKKLARWNLLLPRDPSADDLLYLTVAYGEHKLGVKYRDGERDVAERVLDFAKSLLPQCHLEYEAHKGASEIDSDLDRLFGDDDA